ncbi:hypothetical protein BT96DRAFT_864912 [Gymnopus androsaceus JB14]|uniref:DUF829-domain-containing protein n=1 Tax=Gymnopus androsaceus JB14 TaxID=1447944 RepID=A0A6A4H187_9AGAR|nr:hypothetical protein BT96DRAFT_864912 [Gymnopus androsaceus JB14]
MSSTSMLKEMRPGPVPIGNDIYLIQGAVPEKSPNSDPNIILIFGWMGAKLPHLFKYTKVYEEMYPHATQIVVKSNPEFFWSFNRTRRRNLIPVAEILEAGGYIQGKSKGPQVPEKPPRILVHSFSNGGATQLYTLGTLLRARSANASKPTSTPQSTGSDIVSALVIDSCPGDASFSLMLRAFTEFIPNPLQRFSMTIVVTLLYIISLVKTRIFRFKHLFERFKDGLLSTGKDGGAILPWLNKETPRMYVYSEKDEMISPQQIKKHIEEARRRGLNVRIEVYEDTSHVAHARSYPERYWGAVKDLWDSAVALKQ